MVTKYDVISSRWSSQFWVKIRVFQLLSTIKVNLVAKITLDVVPSTLPPPLPLYHGWGMHLLVRPRVNDTDADKNTQSKPR